MADEDIADKDLLLNLRLLRCGFSPTPDNDLDLDKYTEAYTEMNKFFNVLGPIFHMVSSDVKSKVDILREHRRGEGGEHYATVRQMLDFEHAEAGGGEGAVPGDRCGRPSGARTLLRLHRALEFVAEFMSLLVRPKDDDTSFGRQVSGVYVSTLGQHHGFILRTTTATVLLTLPAHPTLVQRLMNGKTTGMKPRLESEMDQVIAAMKAGYDLTQGLYQQHGFLDLP